MTLGQINPWGKPASEERAEAGVQERTERFLTLLVEGAAKSVLEIDAGHYEEFRARVTRHAMQMREGLPDDDKLDLIRKVLQEFEHYNSMSQETLRDRLAAWRTLANKLLENLLGRTGMDAASAEAAPLLRRVASLLTVEEIHAFLVQLTEFLRIGEVDSTRSRALQLSKADRSTANDNAAGLRGGGVAVEHVQRIMERGGSGFVVLFQMSCLTTIGERFGMDAVHDSVMAVSAFLTHSLRSDDAIYSWSGSSLLAVLQTPASEQILYAAMRRIVDNNRDITIQMGGRCVMLRIPLEFQVTSISQLRSAQDLHRLSVSSAREW